MTQVGTRVRALRRPARVGTRMAWTLAAALVLAGAIAPRGAPIVSTVSAASVPPPVGSRIPWQGGSWYLNGVNIPWFNWSCDFGCGSSGGVSDPTVNRQLSDRFATLAASGVHVARWWVFEGSAWQITRDASGVPMCLDPRVFADLDAALALAARYDLYYELTLFHGPGNVPAAWLTDPAQRARLVAALTPLFARYASHPRVLAFDVMNEPEWDIWNGLIAAAPVQETVRAIAASVHASGTAYVTVGSAMLDGLPFWKGLGLDYYQAHWYDYMSPGQWCARCTDYAEVQRRYALDRPLVIGEFYAGADVDALQRLEDWRAKGYAGAFAWSLFPERTEDRMVIDLTAVATFTGRYSDTGPRGTGATPTATPTAPRTGTATSTTTPAATPTFTATPTSTSTAIPTSAAVSSSTPTTAPSSSPSPAASSTPTPPPPATQTAVPPLPPRQLEATGRKDAIRLDWIGNGVAGATYRVYRWTAGGEQRLVASAVTGTRYDDRDVAAGVSYTYHVTAITPAGESAPTNQTSAIPR